MEHAVQEAATAETRPMSVGEWMITILVLMIPVVNVIMYIYWALSDSGNVNRKTFCQASILWWLIIMGVVLLASFALGGLGAFLGSM